MRTQNVDKNNWFHNPTSTQMLIVILLWIIGNFLLILAITNGFSESIMNKKYIIVLIMMTTSTFTIVKVTKNYFVKRKS